MPTTCCMPLTRLLPRVALRRSKYTNKLKINGIGLQACFPATGPASYTPFCTPLTRLLHASYTPPQHASLLQVQPPTRLSHASTRLLHATTRLLHASYLHASYTRDVCFGATCYSDGAHAHALPRPLSLTRLLLHASAYTPPLTRLLLHAYSYTPPLTRLLLHAYSDGADVDAGPRSPPLLCFGGMQQVPEYSLKASYTSS